MLYYIVFVFLSLVVTFIFLTKKKYFIIAFFALLLLQPVFQKLSDPTIYGDTLRDVSLDRIKTSLILIPLSMACMPLMRFKVTKDLSKITCFFVLYIFFNFLSALFSIDVEQSTNLLLISVICPILFFYTLYSMDEKYFRDLQWLNRSLSYIFLFCVVIGLLYIAIYEGLSMYSFADFRGLNGIWLNNYSMQVMLLFVPILLINSAKKKTLVYIFTIIGILLMLTIAMSRVAIIAFIFQIVVLTVKKEIKKSYLMGFSLTFLIGVSFLSLKLDSSLLDIILDRFISTESSVIETTMEDARFYIWERSFELIKENFYWGIGMGNFYLFTSVGFSDSHNLFISVLQSRGVFNFVLVIIGFIYMYFQNLKISKVADPYYSKFLGYLRLGLIGYLLASMTGSDLFIYSGLCNAWPMYFLILMLVIQLKIKAVIKAENRRKEIKTISNEIKY